MLGSDSLCILVSESDDVVEGVVAGSNVEILLNCDSDIFHDEIAMCVVKINFSLHHFIGEVGVLIKVDLQLRSALIDATPSSQLSVALFLNVGLEPSIMFSDDQQLFVFHN